MAKREKTKYPGVTWRLEARLNGHGEERIYYIRYRRGGRGSKEIEEPVGRESEQMTAAKANHIRALRASGKEQSNTEQRNEILLSKKESDERWTIIRLWEEYQAVYPDHRGRKIDICRFDVHLRGKFGDKEPQDISTADISNFKKKLAADGKSPATIHRTLTLLRAIINFGVKHSLISTPASLHFEMPTVDNERTESFDQVQLKNYLEALDMEPDQNAAALLRLALVTGMRKGALLALKWSDINFERGFITLRGESAKSSKTERIPLTQSAGQLLARLDRTESEYVFPGRDGGQRKDYRRIARRVRDNAGLPKDFRPLHGLRHAYASFLASSGQVDLYTLQKLLTHSSPQMTQRYAHLADETLHKAAGVINQILPETENS